MTAGNYIGTAALSGSSFSADNKSFQTTLHVTAQPIARPATTFLQLQGVQGGPLVQANLAVANAGQGTLTLSAVATGAGSPWLSALPQQNGGVQVTATPGSLTPGFYTGSFTIQSNAANGPTTVNVEFEVQAATGPKPFFAGVVDAASFTAPVAPGSLASIFGSQFATGVSQAAIIPLSKSLGGTSVLVNGQEVPLIYVSPGQINFQMPLEVSPGLVAVQVQQGTQRSSAITAQVVKRAAGFFTFGGTQYAIAQNASRGNAFAIPDIPAFTGIPKAAAHPGEYVVLYGSGFGPVNSPPATGSGAASDPLSSSTEPVMASFGVGFLGPFVKPLYVGLAPGYVGLYQVNVQIPKGLPAVPGSPTAITLSWADGSSSNPVLIDVEP
jgi:uncharacterized protein (TIGR03437 family)